MKQRDHLFHVNFFKKTSKIPSRKLLNIFPYQFVTISKRPRLLS
jgi:hypothetical protein